jgi:hypothetical protein
MDFGIVAPDFQNESRGWFDPTLTRGRGAWGYEPVPDRTVSGNEGKFVGHWGGSWDKKGQQCGKESPINSVCTHS